MAIGVFMPVLPFTMVEARFRFFDAKSGASSFVFEDVDIGRPSPDRRILVVIAAQFGASPGNINTTIAGISAPRIVSSATGNWAAGVQASAIVPSGETADISVSMGASALYLGIGVYRLTGVKTVPTTGTNIEVNNTTATTTLSIPPKGLAVAGFGAENASSITWSGVIKDDEMKLGNPMGSCASLYSRDGVTLPVTAAAVGSGYRRLTATVWEFN